MTGQSITLTATVKAGSGAPTGMVTFMDGTAILGTKALSVTGQGADQAVLTVTLATAGAHSLKAVYAGDLQFPGSTSALLRQSVTKAATATALGAVSDNPSVFGEAVTLTAAVKVTGSGAGTPTGSVTFLNGAASLGAAPVNAAGYATLTISSLAVGTHTIKAVYNGDANFAVSTSPVGSQVVKQAATTTTLTLTSGTSIAGQTVSFTATVQVTAPGAGIPSGPVTFKDGTTILGTINVNGAGHAVFATNALKAGAHAITAVYGPAAASSFTGSPSVSLTQVVLPAHTAAPTVTLAGPTHAPVAGQTISLTATVKAGAGTPTGMVTFLDGSTILGTAPLSVNGQGLDQAMISTSLATVASHSLTAIYNSDTQFAAAASAKLTQVVSKAGTTTAVRAPAATSVYGQPVTFTATLAVSAPGSGTPTGKVVFYVDGAATPAATVNLQVVSGVVQATFTPATPLLPGNHTIKAIYLGDGNFTGSNNAGQLWTQTVSASATATIISSLVDPASLAGQKATLLATVIPVAPGTGAPTGTVTFYAGQTKLGVGTLRLANGVAQAALTATLPASITDITAVYSGDPLHHYLASISAPLAF